MKPITERTHQHRTSAVGRDQDVFVQRFEVEASDVGHERQHYLGFNHRHHLMGKADVGRQIEVLSDGKGWTCWSFLT